jgi:hypothetical protein
MAGTMTNAKTASVRSLREAGCTSEEIRDLEALRENWNPLSEFVDTQKDWRRLQFFKWMIENGHYPRD